ncbi:hypothetical protein GF376_01405 [Candidatus Peregrinibacteria bacterium]|nr:hypothetical protein [Candidatus Peregrinibacteria bacterium]
MAMLMTATQQNQLQKSLSKNPNVYSNYIQVRTNFADVMRNHFNEIPNGQHYNGIFSKLSDAKLNAIVNHCQTDLANGNTHNANFMLDDAELTRLYLILYCRGSYERIKQLAKAGLIKTGLISGPLKGPQNIKLYNIQVEQKRRIYNQNGKSEDLSRMMQAVIYVHEMEAIPAPHYDDCYSKLNNIQFFKFLNWMMKQHQASQSGKLSPLHEKRFKATLLYLQMYTNQPSRFVDIYYRGLI